MLRHYGSRRITTAPGARGRARPGWASALWSSRCPLDRPQASLAHNDKRHSILLEGPACLFSPTLHSLYIAISTEVLIAANCVLLYVSQCTTVCWGLLCLHSGYSRWVPPPW